MRRQRPLALGLVLGLLGAVPMHMMGQDPPRAHQQQQQQQMLRMQEHMQQLNRLMDRMSGVQQRAQAMERHMAQAMVRLQETPDLAQQNSLQIQNHERLRSMAQAMNDGAGAMHRGMEQLRNMMGEPGAAWDGTMERDMAQLRQHWEEMAGDLEGGLQIMDRLRDHIQDRDRFHDPDLK